VVLPRDTAQKAVEHGQHWHQELFVFSVAAEDGPWRQSDEGE
jgi:hypothetical protein